MKKDLLEHMRTIHFVLILTSVALIAAGFSAIKGPLENARDDAEKIEHLAGTTAEVRKKLTVAADRAIPEYFKRASSSYEIRVDHGVPSFLSAHPYWLYVMPKEPLAARWIEFWGWRTLGDFQDYWDRGPEFWPRPPLSFFFLGPLAPPGAAPHSLRSTVRCSDGELHEIEADESPDQPGRTPVGLPSATIRYVIEPDQPNSAPVIQMRLRLGLRARLSLRPWKEVDCFLGGGPTYSITNFTPPPLAELDVRRMLSDIAGANWLTTDFATAFRDLNAETKNLKDLPLPSLVSELRLRAGEAEETVELFKARIPLNILAMVGTILLLGCQLYLWLHLREFGRLLEVDDSPVGTGYAAFYDVTIFKIPVSKVLTVLSVALLPAVSIYFALKRSGRGALVHWGVAAFALLFGLCVWQEFRRRWLELGHLRAPRLILSDGASLTSALAGSDHSLGKAAHSVATHIATPR